MWEVYDSGSAWTELDRMMRRDVRTINLITHGVRDYWAAEREPLDPASRVVRDQGRGLESQDRGRFDQLLYGKKRSC